MLRVLRDAELPAADGPDRVAGCPVRQNRHGELALDRRAGRLAERVGVGPVAHEGGVAVVERNARAVFVVRGHAAWRDLPDLGPHRVEDRRGVLVVDRHLAAVDEVTAAC